MQKNKHIKNVQNKDLWPLNILTAFTLLGQAEKFVQTVKKCLKVKEYCTGGKLYCLLMQQSKHEIFQQDVVLVHLCLDLPLKHDHILY